VGRACSTNGEEEKCIEDIGGKARRKETTEKNQGVDGWTILKWILERQDGMVWIGLIWLKIGTNGMEPLDSIKCWEILEWLHNWQLLKKGSAPLVSD
jgi:hypothetical protein